MNQTPRKPGDTRTVHPQVKVEGISVDQDIAPLLRQLWRRGFITDQSCQGGGERPAYVQFVLLKMAHQFIEQTIERLLMHTPLTPNQIQRWRLRVSVVEIRGRDGSSRIGGLVTFNPTIADNLVAIWEI